MARMLPLTHQTLDRLRKLHGVEADAVLEDGLDVLDVIDVLRGIARDDDEISHLAGGNRTDLLALTEIQRAVLGGDMNRLHGRESCIDQQLDAALIAISQQSSRLHEIAFELHLLLERYRAQRIILFGNAASDLQISRPVLRTQGQLRA